MRTRMRVEIEAATAEPKSRPVRRLRAAATASVPAQNPCAKRPGHDWVPAAHPLGAVLASSLCAFAQWAAYWDVP